ncbi:MAG: dTMP kinase [Betaproteobacteria bacterium]|jgi:dTMP kinase|nr:dTMP kinase [Betaproteobacteria bacterium]
MRGKFITLEGMDGAGKSSHVEWIADWLRARGHRVLVTREPGGTPLGEQLRALVLNEPMDLRTEALLVFAARQEHLVKRIRPALDAGEWVLSDRFTDATYAYQGGGRRLSTRALEDLEQWVHGDFQPDVTLYFDLSVEVARARLAAMESSPDRFEREDVGFFERVRSAYLERARRNPDRIHVIDASASLDEVKKSVEDVLIDAC